MREILFRGKRIDNGVWVEGDLIQLHDGRMYIVNNVHGACIDDKGNFINTEEPFVCAVDPATVGQYTGLKDKNGLRIFEGDVIKTHSGLVGRIAFGNHYDDENGSCSNGWFFAGRDEAGDDCTISLDDEWGGHMVIGNIHDTPELLEGE